MKFLEWTKGINGLAHKVLGSPVRSFVVLASIFGLLTILLVPPFAGADEEAHFGRAYGLSEGNVLINLRQGEQIKMPTSYRKVIGCLQTKQPVSGEIYQYRYGNYGQQKKETFECILQAEDESDGTEMIPTTAAGYSPTTYIPQVIAIWIGKLFGSPIVVMSYMVRFAVLASYIAMIVFAIKLLPKRKWALVGVALLPGLMLIQATNPGADYMLLGASAIFIAAIVRSLYINDKEFKRQWRKLFLIASVALIFLVLPKGIFPGACFLPLVFFFGGLKRHLVYKTGIFVVALLLGLLWQRLVYSMGVDISGGGSNTIFGFPYAFIKTMFYGWINSDFIVQSLGFGIGSAVGYPSIMITVASMLVAMYIFVEYANSGAEKNVSTVEAKLITVTGVAVAAMVVVGSFAAMYIAGSYLQKGDDIIKSVQVRYFYPAFVLLAVLPFSRKFKASKGTYVRTVVIGSSALLITQTIAVMIMYQWWPF